MKNQEKQHLSLLDFSAATALVLAAMNTAAWSASLSENTFLDEVPVVLSVSRLSQPINEAPAAVTIINRQMIRDSGAWDLAEVFRLVPGMYVAYNATDTYTTNSTVSYHGMSDAYSHRMQVLVDGRTVYSPIFGGTMWSDIPLALDDIERIEVTRGPDSASYGANSFMGVINIVTRHSADTQGKMLSLSGGRGRDETLARLGGKNGDLSYRLTAGMRNDRGENAKIARPLSTNGGWDNNKLDDKNIRLVTFRADYRVDASNELELQLGYNGGNRQEGWPTTESVAGGRDVNNHFELLRWRRALDGGGDLAIQFYHANESSKATLLDMDNGVRTNADTSARRYDLELQHTFLPSTGTRMVWGGSVRHDETHAPWYFRNDITDAPNPEPQPFRLARLFGNLEWRPRPDLVFNLGAMAEDNSFTGTDITPRAAVNWHFMPKHTLRVSHSTATRTPTMFEKNREAAYLGTYLKQEMHAERIESSEIGYLGKFKGLNLDVRVFSDNLTDLIEQTGSAIRGGNLNAGHARAKGIESQVQWDLGPQTRLIYAFAHIDIASADLNKMTYSTAAPVNSQSLLLTHRFNQHWNASLSGYQTGSTHFPGSDTGPQDNRRYFVDLNRRWDARLAYHFRAGSGNGELALVVQNLADAHYFEYRHDNELPGRSAWLNLKLDM